MNAVVVGAITGAILLVVGTHPRSRPRSPPEWVVAGALAGWLAWNVANA